MSKTHELWVKKMGELQCDVEVLQHTHNELIGAMVCCNEDAVGARTNTMSIRIYKLLKKLKFLQTDG